MNSAGGMIAMTSIANLFNSLAALFSGFLTAKWLLPVELGSFNVLSIFTSYIILSQLGIPSGLSRELPFYIGQKKEKRAYELASTAQYSSLFIGVVIVILATSSSIYFLFHQNYKYMVGSIVIGVTSFQAIYVTKYLKVLYKSNAEFNKLALITFVLALTMLSTLPLIKLFTFYGLCARVGILFVVDIGLTFFLRPIKVKPSWDGDNWKELFKRGAPIYIVAEIYGLWPVLQRTIIATMIGMKGLGLFAIANIVYTMLNTFNGAISAVVFPKMSAAYGAGKSFKELMKIPMNFVLIVIMIYSIAVLVGWQAIPFLIEKYLPNYIDGIEAAQWMLFASILGALAIFSNVYMVIKKNHHRLLAYSTGIIAWGIFLVLHDLEGIYALKYFSQAFVCGLGMSVLVDSFFYLSYFRRPAIISS